MVDLGVGLAAFNAIYKSLDALQSMKEDSIRIGAILEIQRDLYAAQQQYAALLKTVQELEAKIVEFENWEAEKARYEPRQFEPGVTVYVLKAGEQHAQMGQHFCPRCYHNKKASILQGTDKTFASRKTRDCLECKVELSYGPQQPDPPLRRHGGSWMTS